MKRGHGSSFSARPTGFACPHRLLELVEINTFFAVDRASSYPLVELVEIGIFFTVDRASSYPLIELVEIQTLRVWVSTGSTSGCSA